MLRFLPLDRRLGPDNFSRVVASFVDNPEMLDVMVLTLFSQDELVESICERMRNISDPPVVSELLVLQIIVLTGTGGSGNIYRLPLRMGFLSVAIFASAPMASLKVKEVKA